VEEVRVEIRNLETRIQELKRDTTRAASTSQPTGSVDETPDCPSPSLIGPTELETDIDDINLALQNASMECLGSVVEDVGDELWSEVMSHGWHKRTPFFQRKACDRCMAQRFLVCLTSCSPFVIQLLKMYSVIEDYRALPVTKMQLHVPTV
jgi:hypothetical protein